MSISEHQLETWSHQGPIQSSASTYQSIKGCIEHGNWKDDVSYDIYLQGSYRNSTNIYGNSDVDIIMQFNSIYTPSTENLNPLQKSYYQRDKIAATYTLKSFKTAIIERLKICYGNDAVEVNNKAILVKGNGSRLDADVVVCNPYRKYTSYNEDGTSNYIQGITFRTELTNEKIINYPKNHFDNGVTKNEYPQTYGNYKKIVRILKNLKARMVDNGAINSDLAPSYFLECLIYNAQNNHFRKNTYIPIITDIINQLARDVNSGEINNYLVQNEQCKLFGDGNQQWNTGDATVFVARLIQLWNNH
ncbi:nucleotidyltransferase [Cocleimonas sp. KMM 6892]|uniref:nucleotidyltransferase domain-containing protein n=1 Tax=unclassified Cocleimonas TaxID=2639732 RepID=UPI002DB759E4|nr:MULTISPECIES: nucleotidyltransferase [unclassified Cocleimonas]MEB8432616.1 nucleotidyltransferase [Cocleimonas sp. KMM 6892]MEC4715475.1 nucleotidyltransferase [Cocleimonas sp. KMM 6895]MEC4744907.1 nucleotidyltransferase [Cocleimonas sp. KMM 6896]